MHLSPNINDLRRAGEEWLYKKLAAEELELPDYPRPTKKIKRSKWEMTETTLKAFAQCVYKETNNFLFKI